MSSKNLFRKTDRWSAQWAMGFLSGVSIYGGKDIFRDTSESHVEEWLDKHCELHPNESMTDALADFVTALNKN